jgi:hypothetical protein
MVPNRIGLGSRPLGRWATRFNAVLGCASLANSLSGFFVGRGTESDAAAASDCKIGVGLGSE